MAFISLIIVYLVLFLMFIASVSTVVGLILLIIYFAKKKNSPKKLYGLLIPSCILLSIGAPMLIFIITLMAFAL